MLIYRHVSSTKRSDETTKNRISNDRSLPRDRRGCYEKRRGISSCVHKEHAVPWKFSDGGISMRRFRRDNLVHHKKLWGFFHSSPFLRVSPIRVKHPFGFSLRCKPIDRPIDRGERDPFYERHYLAPFDSPLANGESNHAASDVWRYSLSRRACPFSFIRITFPALRGIKL